MADHEHEEHEHGPDEELGLRIGVRILQQGGKFYQADAEIAPYIDEPGELGVTLVFFQLDGLNPLDLDEDWQTWPLDIDDDLSFQEGAPVEEQFISLVRQLHDLDTEQLLDYLQEARENADSAN